MYRAVLLCLLSGLLIAVGVRSQSTTQPVIAISSYHSPDTDKESWQRLYLWLSVTFRFVVKEGQQDLDSCLLSVSRSLGLSRFSMLAEGFGDRDLLMQSKWIDQKDPASGIRLLSKATGKKHLQLLLLLGSYYAFEPGSYFRYKDSVDYFLHKAIAESKTLKEERWGRIALSLLGKIYLQAFDAKGDSIYNVLIGQCRQANDQETETRAIAWRGIYTAVRQATFQRRNADLWQASERCRGHGDIEGQINLLTHMGYTRCAMGDQQGSHEAFLKALSLAEAIQFPYTHYNTEALSTITSFQGKFGEPLKYTLQTIKVAESSRDSIGWAYFYSRLAEFYFWENRQQEGLDMIHKAIKRFVIDRNPAVFNILNSVTQIMGEEGHAEEALNLVLDISKKVDSPVIASDQFFYHFVLSGCYINLNRLDEAEIHIRKMDSLETILEAIRGPFRRATVYDQWAALFFKRGQYRKTKAYLDNRFKTPSYGSHNLSNDLWAYRLLIATDSALDDKASVISHYKEYTKLLDSNFKATRIRQAEELQVLYETKEKESLIALLNQQAKQTRLVKDLTLTGIVAIIIIAGLLYRQNRLRKKSNKIITHKNGQLQDLLADKEWLLKEIHHRVKNNLEIIMSLLNSQSKYIDNDAALIAINDSQRRVQAISLIHQKLYQSENTSTIDMRPYIDELISYLRDSFDTGSRAVIEQDIDPLRVDVAKALPLGLIINEGIVNAIKYAFPGERKGVVRISLKYSDRDHVQLRIADNGIGLPPDVELTAPDSLGFNLMRGLTRQLDGVFSMDSNKGLQISIRFNPLTSPSYE